jgi:hypothetical protein
MNPVILNSGFVLRLSLCFFPSVLPTLSTVRTASRSVSRSVPAVHSATHNCTVASWGQAKCCRYIWVARFPLPAVASPVTSDPEVKATLPSEHHCLLLDKQPTNYNPLLDNSDIILFLCAPEVKRSEALDVRSRGYKFSKFLSYKL